jgi:hypothetical protein
MYSKSGGKNGKHGAVDAVDSVAAISYCAVQIFEQHFRTTFRPITQVTAAFQCRQFALLPSTALFLVLHARPSPSKAPSRQGIELHTVDLQNYETLAKAQRQISAACTGFRKRVANKDDDP